MPRLGLLQRRHLLVPTWRGWLLLAVTLVVAGWVLGRGLYGFFAPHAPLATADVLVVEGWAPDYMLKAALEEFQRGEYRGLYVTGTPIETGALLAEYGNLAERSAAVLRKMGADPARVFTVPIENVRQDRTYAMAVALRARLLAESRPVRGVNLMSLGPHSRRSQLLYRKAFAGVAAVGILAVPAEDYDAAEWWTSSSGVRAVISEMVAWTYARFLFRAPIS